jgi:uncharacterized protein
MKRLYSIDGIALALAIIGAINWGLVGLFNYNLVESIFGSATLITRIIYALVGVSGVYLAAASPWFARATRSLDSRDNARISTHHPAV